jgi:hypothetical protein
MTSYTIVLSSNPSTSSINYSNINLSDITNLTITLSSVDRSRIPISLKLRWGDGSTDELYTNNFFIDYSKQSILDQIQRSINYTILAEYSHILYPSTSALVKSISCQALITYQDSTSCRFVQPITIYSPSYYAKVGDLELINTNFLSTDKSILYTFSTSDGSVTDLIFNSETGITN